MLEVSAPELRALASGEVIVAFAARGSAAIGDEVELASAGQRAPDDLKPAYRSWASLPAPDGTWTAVVEAVHPAALLDPESGSARHILAGAPGGDLLLLRVYGPDGPVLSEVAFAARRRSVEGALIE